MIRNYITIAWRNITRSRFYSMVNIIGLSAGIAFTLLIMAFVWGEFRVNSALKNTSRQYIIQSDWKPASQGFALATYGALAKSLREQYPGLVANYYRFDGITSAVSIGERGFRESSAIADSTLFTMYGLPMLQGNPATALNEPYTVVITAEKAKKYFGRIDVVGQELTMENFSGTRHAFKITGVLGNVVRNSVTQLNDQNDIQIFVGASNLSWFGRNMDWNNPFIVNYIELQPGVKPEQLSGPMVQLTKNNVSPQLAAMCTPRITSLHDYYFTAENGLVKKMLMALSGIALFILLMAVINFINMAVSRSASRMKEIGLRKVMGGLKTQLIAQFLIESILLVLLSTLIALGIFSAARHWFGQILGREIPALYEFPLYFIGMLAALVLCVGVLAGLYPAFILASLRSVDSLKGKLTVVKDRVWFRKGLVAFQFSTAIIVFAGALIIGQQISYFFSRKLGYEKEYVVAAQVPRNWTKEGVVRMESVLHQFTRMPEVASATLSYEIPDGNNGGWVSLFPPGTDSTSGINSMLLRADEQYATTYNIPMAAGVFFCEPGTPFTDSATIVINETYATTLGYTAQEAVGRQLTVRSDVPAATIVGVTKDFHFESMQKAVQPLTFFHVGSSPLFRYLSFKLKPGNTAASVEALQKKWSALMPQAPFEFKFMDDSLAFVYRTEIRLKQASMVATGLALIIVLLGIIGMVSLSIQKRTREIGIRKVLGSSVKGIIGLFVKDFLPVIGIAALIACPVAWMLMNQWLSDYAYRIDITAMPFVITIALMTVVTTVLIFLQTIKAALTNPVKSMRTE